MKLFALIKKIQNKITTAAGVFALAAITIILSSCSPIDESILPEPSNTNNIIRILPNEYENYDDDSSHTNEYTATEFKDYFYEEFSETEKALYDTLKNAILNFEPDVTFSEQLQPADIEKYRILAYTQESRIFWLSNLMFKITEPTDTINLNYRYEIDDIAGMKGELELAVGTILGGLPEKTTSYDAVIYFHDTIIKNCSFSNQTQHANSAYGALVDGYAQCEGYAFAFSLLCDSVGIENFVVTGKNISGDTHAWNKVKIYGKWYNVDCTWDDPVLKYDNPDFIKHDYLLVSDNEILNITHFEDAGFFEIPVCDSNDKGYFKVRNLLFNTADEGIKNLSEQIKNRGLSGLRETEVRFTSKDAYDLALLRLFQENEIRSIINDINGKNGTGIKSAYKYNNDDLFIIHLSLIYDNETIQN